MIADGVFQKEEEEQFQSRMDIVAERIKSLLEQCQKDRDRWETIYLAKTFWQWIGRLDVAATNSLLFLTREYFVPNVFMCGHWNGILSQLLYVLSSTKAFTWANGPSQATVK